MPVCKNKIDVHAHTILTDCPAQHLTRFPSPEQLIALYDKYGIEKGILLPLVSPEHRIFMLDTQMQRTAAEKYPHRFYWAMGLDPRMMENAEDSDFGELMEYYKSKGAVSVGEMIANLPFDHPLYHNLLSQCAEHDLPVTIHISPEVGYAYGVVDELGLHRLENVLKAHPTLKVLGHSQAFWAHMSTNVDSVNVKDYPKGPVTPGRLFELFDRYENLYGDLSAGSGFNALARDEENGLKFLERYQDRLMFGCDFCDPQEVGRLALWLDEMYLSGKLSERVYLKVCRENAIRILKLQ